MSKKQWLITGGSIIGVIIIAFISYLILPQGSGFTESYNVGAPAMYDSFGVDEEYAAEPAMGKKQVATSTAPETLRADDGGAAATERLIVKTGTLSMVVDNVAEAIAKITDYANSNGGFVVTSGISKFGVAPTGNITIRIPVDVFDAGFEEVKNFGEVEEQTVSGQDVTEEYVDLEAQLSNLKATEAQFLEIMKRAVEIEDVLNVQRELTYIRGQIDSLEGRMKYLRESAAMSTLTVHLSTDASALPVIEDDDEWKPLGVIKDAIRSLIEVSKFFVNFIIWLVIYIPLWLIIGLVVWGIRRYLKKRK